MNIQLDVFAEWPANVSLVHSIDATSCTAVMSVEPRGDSGEDVHHLRTNGTWNKQSSITTSPWDA